jgi:hypothetical protein
MAVTYKLIETVTVGSGGAANIEFTSIPQTYTDLVLVVSVRSARAASFDNTQVAINTSTSNMSARILQGDGASSSSATLTSFYLGDIPAASATSSVFASQTVYLPNYTGSSNKSFSVDSVSENNSTTSYQQLVAVLWSQTAAITQVRLFTGNAANFVQHSSASLYGIKNS